MIGGFMLIISLSSCFSLFKSITYHTKVSQGLLIRSFPPYRSFSSAMIQTITETAEKKENDQIRTAQLKNSRQQNMKRKRADIAPPAQYHLETLANGRSVRYVVPYVQEYRTFAKGRWIGREILEVLSTEFGSHPIDYWTRAIANGYVRVNRTLISANAKFRNSDELLHKTHRHEPPVFGDLTLVGESPTLLAVCKPASMPMHPCGSYRYNSLEYILHNDPSFSLWTQSPHPPTAEGTLQVEDGVHSNGTTQPPPEQQAQAHREPGNWNRKKQKRENNKDNNDSGGFGRLHIVHRLDRVTSGLVVLARTKEVAAELSKIIRQKGTTKIYLARVRGFFPNRPPALQQLQKIELKNFEIDFDADLEPDAEQGEGRDKADAPAAVSSKKDKHRFGRGEAVDVSDLPTTGKTVPLLDEVRATSGVGYVCVTTPNVGESTSSGPSTQSSSEQSKELLHHLSDADDAAVDVWVTCPIGVVSHREGVYACDPQEGKPCLSRFRRLWYCPHTDTSLVECSPYTGRTHQLRLHLQLCGHPIANDPCYGGRLFFNDCDKRVKAIAALQYMKVHHITPLSKVPHFDGADFVPSIAPDSKEEVGSEVRTESDMKQRVGEADDDYLVRTCRYCQASEKLGELEQLLHCDGIWLHALRYIGPDWDFQTRYPDWAIKNSGIEPQHVNRTGFVVKI